MASLGPEPTTTSTATALGAPASNTSQPIQKSFSCVLCAQRKVKCDKSPGGCSNCTKARVPCVYKAPPPPRRRRKGIREVDVNTRLRLYEDTLRKLGVDPLELERDELSKSSLRSAPAKSAAKDFFDEDDDAASSPQKVSEDRDAGLLVSNQGKSRYLENNIFTALKAEFRDTTALLDESSDEETLQASTGTSPAVVSSDGISLLFGSPRTVADLRVLHPNPVQIFKLWQTYLDNVNPLVKVFHTPSVQQLILNASGNLEDIPKGLEALMFSIYCCSLMSMNEAECDAIMGEPKNMVQSRFRTAAQYALVNASFLKSSDIMVLQAFVLFLLSLNDSDARVIWILSGIASRIGQRIGLHRDGEGLGLPPFDVEIRRRLWWQIVFLEGWTEKLAGTGGNIVVGDAKQPRNINDSDLYQGMKEPPKEHEGATEMLFFLIRCEVGTFLKRSGGHLKGPNAFDGFWQKLSGRNVETSTKDAAIDDLEAHLEQRFLQHCDHSIPWHFMCSYLAKAVIAVMRFIAHNPDRHGTGDVGMPQSEKDMLFAIALQVVQYQNMAYTTKDLQGFVWHINMHFQWKSFIHLVSELRYHTQAPEADDAWKEVQRVYEFHPNFAREVSRRALPVAVGNLTLKAWRAYLEARGMPPDGTPYFIQVLQAQREKPKAVEQEPFQADPSLYQQHPQPSTFADTEGLAMPVANAPQASDPLQSFQWNMDFANAPEISSAVANLPLLDPEQMNWSAWENLLSDFQMQDPNAAYAAQTQNAHYGYGSAGGYGGQSDA